MSIVILIELFTTSRIEKMHILYSVILLHKILLYRRLPPIQQEMGQENDIKIHSTLGRLLKFSLACSVQKLSGYKLMKLVKSALASDKCFFLRSGSDSL